MMCLPPTDLGTSCRPALLLLLPPPEDDRTLPPPLLRGTVAAAAALLAAAAARVSAREALSRAIEASRLELRASSGL